MKQTCFSLPVTVLLLGLVGCSKEDGANEEADGGAARAVTVRGQVNEFALVDATADAAAPVPVPVSGVEVCVLDHPEISCGTTDAGGAYTLSGLPGSTELALAFGHDTFFDVVSLLTTADKDMELTINLPSDALATAFAGIVGVTYPNAAAGVVSFFAFTPSGSEGGSPLNEPLSGVEVALTPSSGVGPIYTTSQQLPDRTLTETQPGSSLGFFADVEPGDYEVTFTHASRTRCTPQAGFGWAATASNQLEVRVLAGKLTAASVICE